MAAPSLGSKTALNCCEKSSSRGLQRRFLKDNDHLKLIDFGFAKFWDRSRNMTQACGSTHYVAPEVLGNSYTLKADLWSLGVISYMLLTGTALASQNKIT